MNNNGFKQFIKELSHHRGSLIALVIIFSFLLTAILASWVSPYSPVELMAQGHIPPFWEKSSPFLLGTDDLGRDTVSRLIHGGKISLLVGIFVVFLSMSTGIILGLISGYFGGKTDKIIMRTMDLLMALPSILLAIVVVAILGPGLKNAILAVSIVALPAFVRIVRGSVLKEKKREYVQAAQSLGMGHIRVMFRQILPNCMPAIIVQATLGFSDGILNTAALGFLGLGAEAPTPEWGTMLADARPYIESSPWLVIFPGLCILIVVLAFNVLGDGLRDVLDPRLKI